MKRLSLVLFLLGSGLLSSCSTREIANVPFMAVRPINIEGGADCLVNRNRVVSASHEVRKGGFISDLSWQYKGLYGAVLAAVEKEGPHCVGLANMKAVWSGHAFEGLIGAFVPCTYTVEGNPVYRRGL